MVLYKKGVLFLWVFLSTLVSYSQDLIIKKDSSKIYCQITQEDSLVLYYQVIKNNLKIDAVIEKSDVLKYYKAKSSNPTKIQHKANGYSEKNIRFHFTLLAGQANPLRDFGSKDLTNDSAGMANKGVLVELSAVLKLSEFFGIKVNYFNRTHNFDQKVIEDRLVVKYPGTTFTLTSTPWKMRGILGGMYLTFPIKTVKNLYIEMNGLAGLPKFSSYELVIKGSTSSSMEEDKQNVSSNSAFAFDVGLGIRYRLYKWICFTAEFDYFRAKPKFNNVLMTQTYTYSQGNTGTQQYSSFTNFSQKIDVLNFKAGLSFTFNGISKKGT